METVQGAYPAALEAKYELLACLGTGKNGETLLARDRATGELRIVKRGERCAREARLLQRLAHPGIPVCVEVLEDGAQTCLVRAYIPGRSLQAYAEAERPNEKTSLRLVCELLDILSYMHGLQPPVIHRDIKPGNIIVGEDGRVSLIDFGIAREYDPTLERDTAYIGTQGFCPPEQYGYAQTDARTDVYSLGMVLLYLCTGSIKLPDAYDAIKDRELGEVIRRSTAFAPKDRYESAAAFKRAILRLRPEKRLLRRALLIAGAVCALALSLAVGVQIGKNAAPKRVFGETDPMWVTASDPALIAESVQYLNDKYQTDFFTPDGQEAGFVTNGTIRALGVTVFGLDKAYMDNLPEPDPPYPHESDHSFFPWIMEDGDRVDKRILDYCVVKFFWPEVVTDWSPLNGKEDTGEYPGIRLAEPFAAAQGLYEGVAKHDHFTMGELAVVFANAAKAAEGRS